MVLVNNKVVNKDKVGIGVIEQSVLKLFAGEEVPIDPDEESSKEAPEVNVNVIEKVPGKELSEELSKVDSVKIRFKEGDVSNYDVPRGRKEENADVLNIFHNPYIFLDFFSFAQTDFSFWDLPCSLHI